ncbi:hypothetical protein MuYL_3760 [Mucilaginibacter xinganensis]|uniref:Uncharacterized protein n=1 Tax=Mucilaginibacter xinganensis TaxID=1234841 RepID=A0A223P0K3_9SPHI|nr:hypothetical protein MuYL_3760 [Mucilaginibacter xinganensis]
MHVKNYKIRFTYPRYTGQGLIEPTVRLKPVCFSAIFI